MEQHSFVDFRGPDAGRSNRFGYTSDRRYPFNGSDNNETLPSFHSAARLAWPGTVLRGHDVNGTNPGPINHCLNATGTRKGDNFSTHIVNQEILWPAGGVDGSIGSETAEDIANRRVQNQGFLPYGTKLRIRIADLPEVLSKIPSPRGKRLAECFCFFGMYIVDGQSQVVNGKGVLQIRIDGEVGRNLNGSPISGVMADLEQACSVIRGYLFCVGNAMRWTSDRTVQMGEYNSGDGYHYSGGGGPLLTDTLANRNRSRGWQAFDAPTPT
jgi:hypothetical protein